MTAFEMSEATNHDRHRFLAAAAMTVAAAQLGVAGCAGRRTVGGSVEMTATG